MATAPARRPATGGPATPTDPPTTSSSDPDQRRAQVIALLRIRLAHLQIPDVIVEAAVRSAWARYETASVQTYRSVLTERDAYRVLVHWFGPDEDRPSR